MERCGSQQKGESLSKEEIKKYLLDLMIINEEIHKHENAAETIKRYEDIIKAKRKGL